MRPTRVGRVVGAISPGRGDPPTANVWVEAKPATAATPPAPLWNEGGLRLSRRCSGETMSLGGDPSMFPCFLVLPLAVLPAAGATDWPALVQKPYAHLPGEGPRLRPLLVAKDGKPIRTAAEWEA